MREIVLDVETTGLSPREGHRVIEVACIEIDGFTPTGRDFHRLVDPERDIDPDAERVHGISRAALAGKPKFADASVALELLAFVGEARIVAHNAAFDREFVNHELALAGLGPLPAERWIDTLAIARQRFPGSAVSLDALCRRFKISLAEREKHGALVDTRLLARVYLELSGGRERALDLSGAKVDSGQGDGVIAYGPRPRPLAPRLSAADISVHEAFLAAEVVDALWLK